MSEFSESFHLEGDAQEVGIKLLRRARLKGFVFPPKSGWVTILPESEFGEPPKKLLRANEEVLLRYLFAEDEGWMFEVYQGPESVCSYRCRWLDWSDPEERIVIDDTGLRLDVLRDLARKHGGSSGQALDRIIHPRIVRGTDPGSGESYDAFEEWPPGELDSSPALSFAEALRLPQYRWLGWRYRRLDWGDQGVVEIS